MKKINILYLLLAVLFMYSCSKDKGNYDYKEINDIEISGFKPLTKDNGQYNLVLGSQLTISPELKFKLANEADLSFFWTMGKDTISKVKKLDFKLENISFGKKNCRFTVLNNNTSIAYYHDFIVNVNNPFNLGYYILSEKPDNTSLISFYSAIDENPVFLKTNSIGQVKLDGKPLSISQKYGYNYDYSTYVWSFKYNFKTGTNKTIETDNYAFLPNRIINENSFIDKTLTIDFNPEYAFDSYNAFYISNGKLIALKEGYLYRPAKLGEVELYPWLGTKLGYQNMMAFGFDKNAQKFIHLSSLETDPATQTIGDSNTYDKITEIEGSELTVGQTPLIGENIDNSVFKAITKDADKLYFYNFIFESSSLPKIELETSIAIAGLNENTKVKLGGKTWYILVGSTIYKSSTEIPALTKLLEVEASYGKVMDFDVVASGEKIIVATYDQTSSEELKGSVYFLNRQMVI